MPGQSNDGSGMGVQQGDQVTCEGLSFLWFADELCMPGNNNCPGFDATGCCVVGDNDCTADQSFTECEGLGGTLDADVACSAIAQCNLTGCCVVGDNDCTVDQTVAQCDGLGGTLDPGVACSAIAQCNIPPTDEGCCILQVNGEANTSNRGIDPLNGEANTSNREIDPSKCIVVTQDQCSELNGTYQGNGTTPEEFPEECSFSPPIIRNIPTISQWGMIAMAGLLGIFSLFIIMRRNRYNVS